MRKMANGNELLTVDEAAAKLRVNADTIRRLMRQKKLPGVKVGGQWRISATALQEYIKGGKV
jgi:excisionase family DNA binding protein